MTQPIRHQENSVACGWPRLAETWDGSLNTQINAPASLQTPL